ncbi:hydrogenase maturation nickel metallochaperone HypA [Flexilinea flocculi]|jgi:hydrogenase nickel incorporation protein HypA/HybF|uniref:Hydrogenase maturation factor HypA n=1 Tax=Flexilinea flocculi TaxID=1678840 RepID=A0A0S7BJV2_9CHLR|nr:hydrogenase maturation nickel metallochaperone HypA [Flexilinea flocculi]NMB92581.1 hydrogenase maturation nickel metallochaperone HypA [Flexilinea flocculi]GAP40645.1 hydrogenase-3 nickel incorporation protein HypA [Flexilinea flocculi]
MHELSVTENILAIAIAHAEQNGADQVSAIYLVIGEFSNLLPKCIQYYWNILVQGTICEKSVLHFDHRPAIFHCENCNHEYEIHQEMTGCPNCHSSNVSLVSGNEFWVDSIEIIKNQE